VDARRGKRGRPEGRGDTTGGPEERRRPEGRGDAIGEPRRRERPEGHRPASGGFELLEHTADVGVRAWGANLPELFRAAARGLFEVIAGTESVRPAREHVVDLVADSVPDLLHGWLEELNALHQIQRELYVEFEVVLAGLRLRARVRGEPIDPARHDLRTEVKAITWHDFELREVEGGWEARVLLDI